jgi:hypothetical protein
MKAIVEWFHQMSNHLKREKIMFKYWVGDKVWVKCAGSDAWAEGVVVGFTAKRIKVINYGRMDDKVVCVATHNVREK